MSNPMPNLLDSTYLTPVRVPDNVASLLKSAGGKHELSHKLAMVAPFNVEEFREPFASSAATLFRMVRTGRAPKAWLNDLDPGITNHWTQVRDNPAALMRELHSLLDRFGMGNREMFDLACQMVDSDNRSEAAAGFYVRNHLSMSGTNGKSSFNPSYPRLGRGIKPFHINYIPQFSAWLQGVKITKLDYREVLEEPGKDVMCFLDPPYGGVGKTMYPFGNADLEQLAQHVRASRHSCLVTVDDSPANRVRFADMHPIARTYASSMGDHHEAAELLCANYTTPLYAVHARSIGVMVEPTTVPTADAIATVPSIENTSPAANENTPSKPTKPKTTTVPTPVVTPANDAEPVVATPTRKVLNKDVRRQQVCSMFISTGGDKKNPEWYTPPWLLKHFYAANDNRAFDIDPCSPCYGDDAPVWANQHYTEADNGLEQEWHGRIWLNPPYHSLTPWLKKAADSVWCRHMPNAPTSESAKRDEPLCETVVGIIPARTHARYWRKFVADHAAVFFVSGKIAFLKGVDGKGVEVTTRMPGGLAIIIWGNHKPFSDYLRQLPKSVIDIYERSEPTIPDHPVRYWAGRQEVA